MRILSVLILILVLACSAQAAKLQVFWAAGGHLNMVSTNYKIADIKGMAIAGRLTGGGISADAGATSAYEDLPGEVVPPGTVRLLIDRQADTADSNVRLWWGTVDAPDIYYALTLEAAATSWTGAYLTDSGGRTTAASGFGPDTLGGLHLIHRLQVGGGLDQAYYKALIAGNSPATFLPAAWGVGKVNAFVTAPTGSELLRYSLISVPFVQADYNLNRAIGQQLTPAPSKGDATEIWSYSGTSFGSQKYLTSGGWVVVEGASDFSVSIGDGYVIKTKPGHSDKTITIVGDAKRDSFGPRRIGSSLYTFLGNPYPLARPLNDMGLSGALAGADSGLADQIWGWNGSSFGDQAYLKTGSGWVALSGSGISYLGIGKAYIFRKNPTAPAGFDWRLSP
jgi:hypothetical protein